MHPKDADGMANSVDPDQTASSEAVWSWSTLFAETYLSQYIEFVRYTIFSLANLPKGDNSWRKEHTFLGEILSVKNRPHFGRVSLSRKSGGSLVNNTLD